MVMTTPATSRANDCDVTTDADGKRWLKEGTVIERPDAFKLVGCGVAVPADEECSKLFTQEQIDAAIEVQQRWQQGIAEAQKAASVLPLSDPDPNWSEDE